jgi:hypothetical protein
VNPARQGSDVCRARFQPCRKASAEKTASQAAEKKLCSIILSEAKNLSLFLFLYLNRREILRFAQNDRVLSFSAACFAAARSVRLLGLLE